MLLPGEDGTKSTNAVTPAAPTPLSTAELAIADLTPDLRLRASCAPPAGRGKAREASRGTRPPGTVASGMTAVGMPPTGAIGGTLAPESPAATDAATVAAASYASPTGATPR